MKINNLYSYLDYIRRKDPIGDTVNVPEFNLLCKLAVFKYFNKIFGMPAEYQKGARDPVFGFGLNEISEEKIRPLKKVISVGGTGEGADTAVVLRTSAQKLSFAGKPEERLTIQEILAMPIEKW